MRMRKEGRCVSSEERVIKSVAGCILSTLRASREMALKLPDDKSLMGGVMLEGWPMLW